MKKLLLLIFLPILLLAQSKEIGYGSVGYGGGGSGNLENKSFWSVDLNGTDEYAYRAYAASDSFLNMNGYERTLLPQSTMKIDFTLAYNGRDSLNTFTSGTDTTAGALRVWNSYACASSSITGGKFRAATISGEQSGIKWGSSLTVGKDYYIKAKVTLVSGAASDLYFMCGTGSGIFFTATPSSDEKSYEGTLTATDGTELFVIADGGATGEVYDFDDIEVREVTNSVSNGTMDSTGAWAGTNWAIGTGVATATASSSALTKNNVAGSIGKRYILTYQIPTFAGTSVTASYGGASGTARVATGIYSDTLTATSTGLLTFTPVAFTGTLDNVHLYEIPAYYATNTSSNNHSVGWSKIDALTGAGDTTSLKIIATAVGDSVWQNVKIASGTNTFHGLTAGNKYTLELWARGAGARGSNIVPDSNSSFTTWGLTKYTASSGTISRNDSGWASITATATSSVGMYYSSVAAGASYKVFFRAKAVGGAGTISSVGDLANTTRTLNAPTLSTVWQTYEFIVNPIGTILRLYFDGVTITEKIDFDSIIVQQLTRPKLYVNPKGTLAKLSDSISVIPSTFTKVVYNFTAAAACDTLKFWLSQADTVWIDSVNLSQAYDFVQSFWVYPRTNATKWVYSRGGGGNGQPGWSIYYVSSTSTLAISFKGLAVSGSVSATNVTANQWNYVTLEGYRTAYCSLYVNGVYSTRLDISGIGNLIPITGYNRLAIGGYNTGSDYFSGLIGEFRITRFDNISSSSWTTAKPLAMYNAYTLGNGFVDDITGGGKKIVVWYDWLDATTDAKFLQDLSGNGYNLTGSGVTTADQSRWKR